MTIPSGEVATTGGVVGSAEAGKSEELPGVLWKAIPKEEAARTEEAALNEEVVRTGEKNNSQ